MIWTYEDENITLTVDDSDIKYDAEYMNMFVEQLANDFNWYKKRAKGLERSYVRFHNNDTFVGEMADASKSFIYDRQGDILHMRNIELKKEFLYACTEIENNFKEQVDRSPKARMSTSVLLKIKKDFGTYYAVIDTKGYEIECHAKRLVSMYGKWGIATVPCYRRAMMVYEDFCGRRGLLDKCIEKLENFDQESNALLNRRDFMGGAQDLQSKIYNTAGALDSMTVYKPDVAKSSVGLVGLGLNVSYIDRGLASLWGAASTGSKINVKIFANDKEAAEYLDSQMKVLCDDDNSNDAGAIANINATLQGFLYEEVVDGKRYVAYDQVKIQSTLMHLEKNGLAHQLLISVNRQINANKINNAAYPDVVTKLGIGGKLENTKLQVKKDCAGVRLEVTSNNDILPLNEIRHKPVAYAVTEESTKNYFMNGKDYDWDAIKAWYKAGDDFHDNYHATSLEYDFLACQMKGMSDIEIERLTDAAEFNVDKKGSVYQLSDKLDILADRHLTHMNIDRVTNCMGDDFEKKYARAVLIVNIDNSLHSGAGSDHTVNICYSADDKKYIGEVRSLPSSYDSSLPNMVVADTNSQTISVYLYGNAARIRDNLDNEVKITVNKIAPNMALEGKNFIFDQAVSYSLEHSGLGGANLPITVVSELTKLKDAYELSVDAQGISQALDYGGNAQCMMIRGVAVHVDGFESDTYCVYSPDYDDRKLVFSVAAYNEKYGTHYTIADMKKEFAKECNGNSDIFDSYHEWYTDEGADAREELFYKTSVELGKDKLDEMSTEKLEEYLAG